MKKNIYLIPGQGADYRLYNNLKLDGNYMINHIHFELPNEGENMEEYAKRLSKHIDEEIPYIIIGASLGGMLATEMGDFLNPEKIIVIASAKSSKELPLRYRLQKNIPIYKLISPKVAKVGAQILQPIVEPDRNKEKEIYKQMLKDKDPVFLRRTIEMILTWDRLDYRKDIVHIHGDSDHTIPVKNVKYDYLIKDGSHVMTLTRGNEISELIRSILKN